MSLPGSHVTGHVTTRAHAGALGIPSIDPDPYLRPLSWRLAAPSWRLGEVAYSLQHHGQQPPPQPTSANHGDWRH